MFIRVLLVDDHEVVRRGVGELLGAESDIEVAAEAGSVADTLAVLETDIEIDVAVVDVRLPDGDGIDLCRVIRQTRSEIRCLVLTAHEDDDALLDAHAAGVHAFLLKQVRGTDLIRSVRTVASGVKLIDPVTLGAARDRVGREGGRLVDDLTPQEHRVFDLIGEGCSNRDIAERLGLAEKTVKNYMTSLLLKLNMERRTEVAALAARLDERSRRRSA